MAVVDRTVLRLGAYELLAGAAPAAVVIDEAIELARTFSGEEAARFVNGVLDGVKRTLEQRATSADRPDDAETAQ
jgi:N utilization substance protein B